MSKTLFKAFKELLKSEKITGVVEEKPASKSYEEKSKAWLEPKKKLAKAPQPNDIDSNDEEWSFAHSLGHFLSQGSAYGMDADKSKLHTGQRPDGTFYHRISSPHRTVHLITGDKQGENAIAHMIVDHKSFGPQVCESVVDNDYLGKGFGTALYLNALKHHKTLESDDQISSNANRLYNKIAKHPNVSAKLDSYPGEGTHKLEYVKTHKKLAASELAKAPIVADQPGMSRPHTSSEYEGMDAIHTFDAGTFDVDPNDINIGHMAGKKLYHHVFKKPDYGHLPGKAAYLHAISLSEDPWNDSHILSSSSVSGGATPDKAWAPGTPWKENERYAQIGESITRPGVRGRGLGKKLYEHILGYHGRLASDTSVSPEAQKVWGHISKQPGVKSGMGPEGQRDVNWAQADKEYQKPVSSIQYGGESEFGRKRKLAASELAKAPNPYYPTEGENETFAPYQSKTLVNDITQKLPNGMTYTRHKETAPETKYGRIWDHHHRLSDANGNVVAEIRTKKEKLDPYSDSSPKINGITWSQVHPDHKGKGYGRQLMGSIALFGGDGHSLASDLSVSPQAHKAWKSFKNSPGFGGKLNPYTKDQQSAFEDPDIYNNRHVMFVRNRQQALEHLFGGQKEEKLAASELEKGVKQRLFPVKDEKQERDGMFGKAIRRDMRGWQISASPSDRERVAKWGHTPNERKRALHNLAGSTKTMVHPETGERHYLLHRGVSKDERSAAFDEVDGKTGHNDYSSWTPIVEIADDFSKRKGFAAGGVASAWIPESAISSIPKHLGSYRQSDGKGSNIYSGEHEVIVNPGEYDLEQNKNVKQHIGWDKGLGGKGVYNIDQAINLRGKMMPNDVVARQDITQTYGNERRWKKLAASELDKSTKFKQDKNLTDWQSGLHGAESRDKIKPATGDLRRHILSHIYSKTKSRRSRFNDGKKEFLLHRGVGVGEYQSSLDQLEGAVQHSPDSYKHSSWTTNLSTAKAFGKDYAEEGDRPRTFSAWIHEDDIVHSPSALNNEYPKESEVIVRNGPMHYLKSLRKGVKTPSKHIPLARLKQIKQDNYVGEGGKDYSQEELDYQITARQQSIMDRESKRREEIPSDKNRADYSWMFTRNSPFGVKGVKK